MLFYLFHFINCKIEEKQRNAIERLHYIDSNPAYKIIYRENHLPDWAGTNPYIFFKTAMDNTIPHAHVYREVEFSCMAMEMQKVKEYLHRITEAIVPNKYFIIIVQSTEKTGIPYLVHILFNDGIIDKYEQAQERPQGQFFRLYRSRNPKAGGARKDFENLLLTEGEYIREYRKRFIRITNAYCEEKKIPLHFLTGIYLNSYEDLLELGYGENKINWQDEASFAID